MEAPQKYSVVTRQLLAPSLEELSSVLNEGLKKHFTEVDVQVIDCPDLRNAPYHLAGETLCGNAKVADVGGVPYLIPTPHLNKPAYSLIEIGHLMGFKQASIVGASFSPHAICGNCELIPNLYYYTDDSGQLRVENETHGAKIGASGECVLFKPNVTEFNLLGNLFVCDAKPGKVLKIKASKRIAGDNFTTSIRNTLREKYGTNRVSVGGVFVIKQGAAKLHIMPELSKTPLNTPEDVNNWLKFYEMKAPLICLTVFHSYDDDLDLRVEHTHCFSTHGAGGHYHEDTTPDDVEYEAIFNVAEQLYRIDAPPMVQKFHI
ncbi:Ester hydrolase-like protein [Dinothrombium tinctorium]|uniref:Ester hydrolase-like protein n=1 Tax=Dinothrombium tinctorium TaxID=1965070 RepID=A0A3S4QUC5_9ACAR|nr:Ester hydrolase-like protein [Dinothrombium tinctorium]